MNKLYEIIKMLNSKDYYVKQYALDALRKFESFLPSCVAELLDFFVRETDSSFKCAVLKLFTQKKLTGHFDFFAANVENCDYVVKIAFFDYIGETVETTAKEYLINSFYKENNPRIRSKIVKTVSNLLKLSDSFHVEKETIFDFLSDADARVRANACSIKADFGNIIIKAEYKKLLSDSSSRVVADAAIVLYNSGDQSVADYIEEKLERASGDGEKSSLLYAMGKIKSENAYPVIKKYLRDANHDVRRNAITSSGALKLKEAITDLLDLYFIEQKECRENLSKILGALKAIDEFDSTMAILDMLNGSAEDCFKRATLVKVLAHFASSDMAHYIVSYLDDTDERVRANAVEAICFLKEREAVGSDFVVKNLLVSMCDTNSRVVANSVRALYAAGVVSVISVLREMLLSNTESVRDAARHVVSYFPEGLVTING